MAGHLKLHPLTKSYDDLRRTRKRLKQYISVSAPEMDQETYTDILSVIGSIDDLISLIPVKYWANTYEIKQMYEKLGD